MQKRAELVKPFAFVLSGVPAKWFKAKDAGFLTVKLFGMTPALPTFRLISLPVIPNSFTVRNPAYRAYR